MSALPRERLLEMFDLKHEVSFAHSEYTKINRYFDDEAKFPLIEKAYQGALNDLHLRENDLLFNVAQETVLGQEVTSRVAALFRFKKVSSVVTGRQIYLKWYGFDLDDWDKLLQGVQPNPMHQARWLLELTRSTLKALQLLHTAGYVHSDIHMANLCLPHADLAVQPDGKSISCTVDPDKLKLIDLGLSLKRTHQRGLPPRFAAKPGEVGRVIQFNSGMVPANPSWLYEAYAAAQSGDNTPFLALDWRVDLWRTGKLLEHWWKAAWDAEGLAGSPAQRKLAADLPGDLMKCVPGSDHDANGHLPHQLFIDQIDSVIDKSQAREFVIALDKPVPAWVKKQLKPRALPPPDKVEPPVPETVTPSGSRRVPILFLVTYLVMGGLVGAAGYQYLKKSKAAEGTLGTVPAPSVAPTAAKATVDAVKATAAQAAKDAAVEPAKKAASAQTPGQPAPATHAGAPVLVVLPKVLSAGPGTKLGQVGGKAEVDEKPPYEARLPYTLAMGEAEITFEQWNQCVKDNACNKGGGDQGWPGEDLPAMNISWNDIQGLDKDGKVEPGKGYFNWLNKKAGIDNNSPNKYRLPTEAEWELAARAGSDGQWSLGADNNAMLKDSTANYSTSTQYDNSRPGTMRVKSFQPNKWGLHDMHGNVWEWVQDCYSPNEYEGRKTNNGWNASQTAAEVANCNRVLRGGSWTNFSPWILRSAARNNTAPGSSYYGLGFRVARTLPPPVPLTGSKHLDQKELTDSAVKSKPNQASFALGAIKVQSLFGFPLRAEIEIPNITAQAAAGLKTAIASPDAFRAAGLTYDPALAPVKVSLQRRGDGRPFILLTSDVVITQPFVDFILEVTWNGGRIVRDYTMLFDPPLRKAATQSVTGKETRNPRQPTNPIVQRGMRTWPVARVEHHKPIE